MIKEESFAYINLQGVKKINCNPVQYGWHKYSSKGNLLPVVRQQNILHIVTSGKGVYKVFNKTYSISKNQCFIIRPFEIVQYFSDPDELLEYVWIGFDGVDTDYVLNYIGLGNKNKYIIDLEDVSEIKSLIENLISNHNGENNIIDQGYLNLVIQSIHENLKLSQSEINISKNSINKVLKYIAENIKTITIKDLSLFMNLERTGLYKMFIREFGISPQQYIINCRLEMARELIIETNIDLKEVCYNTGFNNYSHFSRTFTKYYLTPPSQYRKPNTEERQKTTNEKNEKIKF